MDYYGGLGKPSFSLNIGFLLRILVHGKRLCLATKVMHVRTRAKRFDDIINMIGEVDGLMTSSIWFLEVDGSPRTDKLASPPMDHPPKSGGLATPNKLSGSEETRPAERIGDP